MAETSATFPNPDMPTIHDSGINIPKTDAEMTYPKKKNIDEAIHQKLSNKDVYKLDMHKIYNVIVGQMNEQPKEKAASYSTFQAVNNEQDPICYLMILTRLFF